MPIQSRVFNMPQPFVVMVRRHAVPAGLSARQTEAVRSPGFLLLQGLAMARDLEAARIAPA